MNTGQQLPKEVLSLMKSQDLRYVQMQKLLNERKLDRLQAELPESFVNADARQSHIFFAEDEEEKASLLQSLESGDRDEAMAEKVRPSGGNLQQELEVRRDRLEKLQLAESKLILQRHIMQPGRRKIVGTDQYGHPIFKWKAIRQK